MTTAAASGGPILTAEQIGTLVVQPVLAESVATRVSTVVMTAASSYRVPVLQADPSSAWVAEGSEISPSDATFAEVDVVPAKLAGLTIISRELADDASPQAAETVGQAVARDISRQLDRAYFSSVAAPAPDGLADLAGVTADVVSGTAWANLDGFAAAISDAEQVGATLGYFVTNPATALELLELKDQSGSNRPLLGNDPANPTQRVIFGVPLLVSQYVAADTVWGVPRDRCFVVVREDTRIDVSTDVYFTSDRIGIKATMRVGFAFAHPAAVVKITLSGV